MTLPVFILARVPGAAKDTVEWTDICHRKTPFVYIAFEASYTVSRWHTKERKRPFAVHYDSGHDRHSDTWSYHRTLDAAIKAANKLAMEAVLEIDVGLVITPGGIKND